MSRIIGYSDNANHLLKSRPKGYSDGTNHLVKERWVGGADGANHKVWSSLSVGDTYVLGGYNWTVLDINASGQATLLCQSVYGTTYVYKYDYWSAANNSVRLACEAMYATFSAADQAKIVPVTHTASIYSTTDHAWILSASQIYGTSAAPYCEFITGEVKTVNPSNEGDRLQYFVQNNTRAAVAALFGTTNYSWTRTMYVTGVIFCLLGNLVSDTSYAGYLCGLGYGNGEIVRPAILINP